MQGDDTKSFLSSVPPIDLYPELPRKIDEVSFSKPFYSNIGGYKLQLEIQCIDISKTGIHDLLEMDRYKYNCRYNFLDSEFEVLNFIHHHTVRKYHF